MGTSASYPPPIPDENKPVSLSQAQLNDLTRDLGLSKRVFPLLGSRLDESRLLASGTTYFCYRKRDEEFRKFFSLHGGLVKALGLIYNPVEWRLFIELSRKNLKAVL